MTKRVALTIRGINREYGVSREWISERIKAGELPASRRGKRRVEVLRRDWEALLRRYLIRQSADDHAFVAARLAQEQASP